MIKLTVSRGDSPRQSELFTGHRVSFGRAPDNDLVLPEHYISRLHGEFLQEAGQWYILDRCSKMGTKVLRIGGEEVYLHDRQSPMKAPLEGGETVQIVNTSIHFDLAAEQDKEPPRLPLVGDASTICSPTVFSQFSELSTLQAKVHRERELFELLYELSRELSSLQSLEEILQLIGRTVFKAYSAGTHFLVCLKSRKTQEMIPWFGMDREGRCIPPEEVKLSHSIIDMVLSRKMAMVFQSTDASLERCHSAILARIASSMTVPLSGQKGWVGVLQVDNRSQKGKAFKKSDLDTLMVLASNVALAVERASLQEDILSMFEGFVAASVAAIEARDPTTSGHSRRVADLAVALALEVNKVQTGKLAGQRFSGAELTEIRYAALLHDIGKVGVREKILVKARRLHPEGLERIQDRMRFIRTSHRARVMEQAALALAQSRAKDSESILAGAQDRIQALERQLSQLSELVDRLNGGEPTTPGCRETLRHLADLTYLDEQGQEQPFLTPAELECLLIDRGTLTKAEHREIEAHVEHTSNVLRQIPWSRDLEDLPRIAMAHHEKLDGSGYPRKLSAADIPCASKILAICDIYDALTASDRYYRKALSTEKGLEILREEAARGGIDPDLVELFIASGIYRIKAPSTQEGRLSRSMRPMGSTQ